jgi:N6-adenosine-specific RNA methylase IME4
VLPQGALYDTAGRFFENVTNPRTNKTTEYLRIWKFNTETKQFEVRCRRVCGPAAFRLLYG